VDEKLTRWLGRLTYLVDIDDQVKACRWVFASNSRWTVVRGSDLEEGESQGLPVWSRHVGDPILKSNRVRCVDLALFMIEALENDELIHEAPAIIGCQMRSALALAAAVGSGRDRSRSSARESHSTPTSAVLILGVTTIVSTSNSSRFSRHFKRCSATISFPRGE